MSMAGSWSSTNNPSEEYDVFLSFRGEDTRNGFTSHLNAALCRKTIHTFIDDQIVRGDEISSSLLNTIKASKISVIIFSKNYASSRWCLQELEEILHCKKTEEQIVIPVFYHVDPSDVRNQTGSFGDGFAELEKRTEKLEMLQRWKTCLNEAASLAGWTINDQKSESKLIDETLDDILVRLNKLSPSDYTDLVGIEFSIKTIESLLHKGSNGVPIIGIWGIGGVGKTTIARVVFNKIFRDFEGSHFVENVREESEKSSSLTHLQKELLSAILEDRDPNIGLTFTRKRLKAKKVLIVFDDVTSLRQIENLIGNLYWLSSKSQIIITTRDKQVLRNCGVDDAYIYKVEGLREKEAYKLFSRYAFKHDSPTEDYMELSNKAIAYTKFLPLALKVLGSHLFSHGKEFWESAINNLEKNPPSNIQKALKVSYDGLENEKGLFLDIACFFKGEQIDLVIDTLNNCGISTKQGIQVLIDKCLVSVTFNTITMHDLLQEMGWKIARDDTCKDIRLWHPKDIFTASRGIEAVRSINLDVSKISNLNLNCHVLSKMDNLRFFRVYNSNYPFKSRPLIFPPESLISSKMDNYENKLKGFEELESFPSDITFFSWNNYPFKSLPSSFPLDSLTTLVMQDNKVKHWSDVQSPKLDRLILSRQFGAAPLNWVLNSSSGSSSFVTLHLKNRQITKLPDNLGQLSSLQSLFLSGNDFESMPENIKELSKLYLLDISNCRRLQLLPELPMGVNVKASNCSSLQSISDPSFLLLPHRRPRATTFANCFKLDLSKLLHDEESCREFCANIYFPGYKIPKWFAFQNTGSLIALHQSPDWQNKNFLGFLISAVVGPRYDKKEQQGCFRVTCYCLVKSKDGEKKIYRNNIGLLEDNDYVNYSIYLDDNSSDHVLFGFHPLMKKEFEECDDEICSLMKLTNWKVLVRFHANGREVKKCGIHFLCVKDDGEPLETSRKSVDDAKNKGKEKKRNGLLYSKLQISKFFNRRRRLRRCIMSETLREINPNLRSSVEKMNYVNPKGCMSFPGSEILEWFNFQNAGYFIVLPRGTFRLDFVGLAFCTVVEFPDLIDLGQPFFINCELGEMQFKENYVSYQTLAIGGTQGWFEGDRTHCIKSDHVFLGMYNREVSKLSRYYPEAIIYFEVADYNGISIKDCKVKKCGVRFLYPEDFEDKWKNPIDLSFLKRMLELNENMQL